MGIFNAIISSIRDGYRDIRQGYNEGLEENVAKIIKPPPRHPSPGVCHQCHIRIADDDSYCLFCGSEKWPGTGNCYKQVRVERSGANFKITYSPFDKSGAKRALKELKLIGRAVSNLKRSIMETKRQVRADFTHSIRKPRFFFDKGADLKRMSLADALAPLDENQRLLEGFRISILQSMIEVERIGLSFD